MRSEGGKAFDLKQTLKSCIDKEREWQKEHDILSFADRLRECIAQFQDSHLYLSTPLPFPGVTAGFTLMESQGHFYISRRDPAVITLLRDQKGLEKIDEHLAVGAEVLLIDGKSPAAWSQELKKYISASSDGPRHKWSVASILDRTYRYPTAGTFKLKLKGFHKEMELPWWTKTEKSNVAAARYLRKIGVQENARLHWHYNAAQIKWEPVPTGQSEGYDDALSIVPPRHQPKLSVYINSQGNPVLRFGIVPARGHAVGYLQILSFASSQLWMQGGTAPAEDFGHILAVFLKECQQDNVDLIIDVRSNGGGSSTLVLELLSELATNAPTPEVLFAFRITRSSAQDVASIQNKSSIPGQYLDGNSDSLLKVLGGQAEFVAEEFEKAAKLGKHFTPLFLSGVPARNKQEEFQGKMIALTSHNCASACDLFAAWLKKSKRGQLLGTASNGTGAGYLTAVVDTEWRDSTRQFVAKIPNFLFGMADRYYGDKTLDYPTHTDFLLENRPTVPDVTFEPTQADLTKESFGWWEKALNTLYPK